MREFNCVSLQNGSPLRHAGVSMCISKALSHDMLDVTFHAYSESFAPYTCHLDTRHCRFLHVTFYFIGSGGWCRKVCEPLNLFLVNCRRLFQSLEVILMRALGAAHTGDDLNTVGGWGFGRCNARRHVLMQWALKDCLLVQNRLGWQMFGRGQLEMLHGISFISGTDEFYF